MEAFMNRFLVPRALCRAVILTTIGLSLTWTGCGSTQVEKTDDSQQIEENRKKQAEMSQMERTNE